MTAPDYIEFDERTDVLASLTLCLWSVKKLRNDTTFWKWAILSLHNAVQGALVCHLSGTAQLGALSDDSARAMIKWHEQRRRKEIEYIDNEISEEGIPTKIVANRDQNTPNEYLADAKELFRRLFNENKRYEHGAGAVLTISESEKSSFNYLHKLRNDFSHFTPKSWLIELKSLPDVFLDILDVLEKIANDPWPFRHMEKKQTAALENLLRDLRRTIGGVI